MNHQLALSIQLNEQATFSDFHWGENSLLNTYLEQSLAGIGEKQIYIWGQAGSGKSHLLQACCQSVALNRPAIYLPLSLLIASGPEIIDGLDEQALLCVDELDAIAGHAAWEEALFHLYNRVRDAGRTVMIFAAEHPPRYLAIQLRDLQSRLTNGLVVQLHELDDEAKVDVLCRQAHKRGLELPLSVGQFLVNRCARNMHDLHALLLRLDEASWVSQRRLTIPFIKTILAI